MQDSMDLKQALFADREASFFRLRAGYPIPLAGATWWAILGTAGYLLPSRGQWSDLSSCLTLRPALQSRLYARQDSGRRRSLSYICLDAALLADRNLCFLDLPSTCSARAGHRYVASLAGHRLDVWPHRDLYGACVGPSRSLLCPLELVAFHSLHRAPLHGLCHLPRNCVRNSHRLVS